MKKLISILGSTGSIGRTTLKIVHKKNSLIVDTLVANKNYNFIDMKLFFRAEKN